VHGAAHIRWMMGGDVDEVMAYTAQQNHKYLEAEDLGLALIKFSNGSFGLVEGTCILIIL